MSNRSCHSVCFSLGAIIIETGRRLQVSLTEPNWGKAHDRDGLYRNTRLVCTCMCSTCACQHVHVHVVHVHVHVACCM